MKKSTAIHLVLITAALAACNRPMYQQEYQAPAAYPGDLPDSTNSCPIESAYLPFDYYNWMYAFRPYGSYYVDPTININFYYPWHYGGSVHRSGFGGKIQGISS
jgi:hypothetical protein